MRIVTLLVFAVFVVGGAFVMPPPARGGGQMLSNTPLPPMPIPADNPQTDAKVRLGRELYFDGRLSADGTISCATCHKPLTGWANDKPTDTGIQGQVGGRNSGTVIDSGYMRFQFWDGRAGSLEEQALGPIHNPVEMGETLENVVRKLSAIPGYRDQFMEVFGTEVTTDGIAKAIAAFERSIVSAPSPFDLFMAGDRSALSASAQRGMAIFNGKGHCTPCHSGAMFSDQSFHNIGVGMDKEKPDVGRSEISQDDRDWGKFKTPGLRNVAKTPPYLHDGSEATLLDVVNYYDRGGIPNRNLDPAMLPLHLTESERQDLVAFLEALTGNYPVMEAPPLPQNVGSGAGTEGGSR